jgi:hypothetical protein
VRHLTRIPAILKLPQILRAMLRADVNLGAIETPAPDLYLAPDLIRGGQ